MADKLTVALVQARPVYNDLPASLEKAIGLIAEAAAKGAKLVAFGECWLAGYPAWLDVCPNAALWNHEPTKRVFAEMRRNSLVVGSPETEMLANAARENKVTVVIGANEKVEKGIGNGTLYNALLTFDETGKLANHHRKLVPTYTERLVHGNGDGDGLNAVEMAIGRVGGLVCWEHWMPLARQAMHNAGEQIHIAVFPTVHEMHRIATRHYAFEGRCFVLAVGLIMNTEDLPNELLPHAMANVNPLVLSGGSCVIAPDGSFILEPVYDREEILTAEIDLSLIDREKMTLDVSGHYQRRDVFDFDVNQNLRTK
ncbi:MAG: carbon-nitrogen hydrolase family protein [Pyrinomonadaceae bacterium]|nr:carbon-nitrogen hydrolase family protein [Pyrinomonadaceae bacterium]